MDQRLKHGSPTIYVVEDDAAVRSALEFALELEGFAVETFASGEALLSRDRPVAPGCFVIDENLPGVSGLETLRQLRARSIRLPALFVTTHPKGAFRDGAAQAGAPILEKPLESEALVTAVRELLDLFQGGR